MGSFATSLHVKSNDANRVAATLKEILAESGWRATEKTPGRDVGFEGLPTLRGLHISAPREGWVSILDTDLMGSHELVSELAERLATHAIFVFVNDSDSWSYRLADAMGAVSEFDSEEREDDFDDEDYGDMVQSGPAIDQLQAMMRDGSFMQKMQEFQKQMFDNAPPNIREALSRMQSGQGTAADMQQYQGWAKQEMPKYTAQVRSLLGGALDPFRVSPQAPPKKAKRKPTKAERAQQRRRLDPLRPILAAGVTDEQVQAVLDTQAVYAEEILAEFLPLIGIGTYYSNLSYRYLEEAGDDELAAENIRFVHHLRFETNSPPQFAIR